MLAGEEQRTYHEGHRLIDVFLRRSYTLCRPTADARETANDLDVLVGGPRLEQGMSASSWLFAAPDASRGHERGIYPARSS